MSTANYPHPAVTVDVLVFSLINNELKIALVRRDIEPFKGIWAIPGGFVKETETLETAAKRELKEEAGIKEVFLEQLYTFGDPKRDPRERVITVAYYALTPSYKLQLRADTDVSEAKWFGINKLPELAFDHRVIVNYAIKRLRAKLEYTGIAHAFLPDEFRLSELQAVYEAVLNKKLDKRNFRKHIETMNILESTKLFDTEGAHRPARLYRVRQKTMITL